ncbi:MAG TPA: hypothetical protein VLZ28_07485 [Daejeonella sp.]|nr:hypothetical protein [Daejeonella sp.]
MGKQRAYHVLTMYLLCAYYVILRSGYGKHIVNTLLAHVYRDPVLYYHYLEIGAQNKVELVKYIL